MINRILIRIKVVQLLYSHLLIERRFSLESQPTPPTKEKRFAYNLYLDQLYLLVRIAEKAAGRSRSPLSENPFIKNLRNEEKIRSLAVKYQQEPFPYEAVVDQLAEKVKESAIVKNLKRKDSNGSGAERVVWRDIYTTIVAPDSTLTAMIARQPNYSMRAEDRAKELIDATFTSYFSAQSHSDDALKSLRQSLDKARELYFRLLMLIVDLTKLREMQIHDNMQKYLPTEADKYPDTRFCDNALALRLQELPEFTDYVEKHSLSWLSEDRPAMERLLKAVMASDIYQEYMAFPATDLTTDCNLWRDLLRHVILPNVDFLELLEDQSVFWNDDLEIIGTFVLKTIKRIEEGEESPILAMYKDEEDARFGKELFMAVIDNREQYRALIDEFVNKSHWDTDRLAFMDVVITMTAIAEILEFPKIPTSVSVNEYIELAKSYSTPKSGAFVHGLLGAITGKLRQDGLLTKE